MPTPKPPRPALDARHRRLDESQVIDMLLLEAWAVEMTTGRLEEARQGAAKALDIAIAAGAGYAEPAPGRRLFDPVEVQEFLDWSVDALGNPYWRECKSGTNEAFAAETRSFARLDDSGDGPPARFRVALRRTFDLRGFAPGAPVRLRLPTPLRCDYHQEVSVTPLAPPGAEGVQSDGRLEVRLAVPADPVVTIGADLDFVGLLPGPRADAGRLSPEDAEIYLRPVEGLVQVTPRVEELARRLAADSPPLAAVNAFITYMTGELHFVTVRYEELAGAPCDWVLDNGGYDCSLCSALMVALCRSRGIPARMVNGHYLSRLAPTNHAWVEIWVDGMGWLPLDILHRERHLGDDGEDRDWWNHFVRRRDYRMATERLPLAFTGPMSVRFPPAWQMLHTAVEGGLAITYTDIADGSLIYQDRLAVDWLA